MNTNLPKHLLSFHYFCFFNTNFYLHSQCSLLSLTLSEIYYNSSASMTIPQSISRHTADFFIYHPNADLISAIPKSLWWFSSQSIARHTYNGSSSFIFLKKKKSFPALNYVENYPLETLVSRKDTQCCFILIHFIFHW